MMPARGGIIDCSQGDGRMNQGIGHQESSQHNDVLVEMHDKTGYYFGDCVDDKPHGDGILKSLPHLDDVYQDKHVLYIVVLCLTRCIAGQFVNGVCHGTGVHNYASGQTYKG